MIRVGLALWLVFEGVAACADWPQFLGPSRNGVSPETNLSVTWPKEGPPAKWRVKVGAGWSGPVVVSNRVFLFHRVGESELLQCFATDSGKEVWKSGYRTTYRDDFGFDEGPRATPVIGGNRIFTYGANGVLNGWAVDSGTNLWRVDARQKFGAEKGFFGVACSPLVDGNKVIVNVGGKDGAGIVAFDAATGQVLWKASTQGASYSSPVVAEINGTRYGFVLGRSALVALNLGTGSIYWEFPFKPAIQASVTAATPVVFGDQIFISASYGAGAALLRFKREKPDVIWGGDDILSNHYATSVHRDGFLYGFDGRQEQRCHLRCIEAKTGKVRWTEQNFGAGNVILAGDKLVIVTEAGELVCANASPEKFSVIARAQILGSDCRAAPAISNGFLYARDKAGLVTVDLRSP